MNPQEALNMLNKVCAQMAMNRADHLNVVQAVETLQALILASQVKPAEKESPK